MSTRAKRKDGASGSAAADVGKPLPIPELVQVVTVALPVPLVPTVEEQTFHPVFEEEGVATARS
jgi:hypothetical protein